MSETCEDLCLGVAKFMTIARNIDVAANCLARQARMIVHLSLRLFDPQTKETAHGKAPVGIDWMVPLHGRHELKNQIADNAWNKKNLKVDAGTPLVATISFALVGSIEEFKSLTMAESIMQKEPKDELLICDASNSAQWRVGLTYTDKVLSSVSLVHDSTEHQELTDYLHEIAKLRIKHDLTIMTRLNPN